MLVLLESRRDVTEAQTRLEATIARTFKRTEVRSIGYPGGTDFKAKLQTNGLYYHRAADYIKDRHGKKVPHPRHLNWFGKIAADGDLQIIVEVNTAYEGRDNVVGGFFAKDLRSGRVYFMHSGRVAGGTKGVSKETFLAWSNEQLVDVVESTGAVRQGIVVMPIEGRAATKPATRYIGVVAAFKAAVRAGETRTEEFRQREQSYRDYYAEGSGRRKGTRQSEIDYLSRHGDVVDALHAWRSSRPLPEQSRVVKNQLIDLGVARDKELLELFEVKTSTNRSDVYAAIGQLLVHGCSLECRRSVVLPHGQRIPHDIAGALERLKIELRAFRLDGDSVTILGT